MQKRIFIDYLKVNKAINYYNRLGFQYIPVPWIVSDEVFAINDSFEPSLNCTNNIHIPSGEQSFLQLILKGKLKEGKYQCCTAYNTGEEWYMRVELFKFNGYKLLNTEEQKTQTKDIVNISQAFFEEYIDTKKVQMKDHLLIKSKKDILGKYGYREYDGFSWIYGTGIDEPKFSEILKVQKSFIYILFNRDDIIKKCSLKGNI